MAQPTGTVENSSVLIINHPPSSMMRDWSFYTHRTTQCHSKYGWKIKPNSLPSKWTRADMDWNFFFFTAHRCKGKKKVQAKMDVCIYDRTIYTLHRRIKAVIHLHTPANSAITFCRWTRTQLQNSTALCWQMYLKRERGKKKRSHLSPSCSDRARDAAWVCAPQEVCVKLTAQGPCFKKPPETC